MRYEHLVEIDDLGQAVIPVHERAHLWSGLLALRQACYQSDLELVGRMRALAPGVFGAAATGGGATGQRSRSSRGGGR